jgi:Carboxypeptidase regulatory-like domain
MNYAKFAPLVPVFVALVLICSKASAQSTISGQVKDTSGAVMSGVRVEAASPALIEKSRTATTSGDGRYTIVDVRPGTYTMTFTIEGFATLKRQVEVPSSVTVPVDAEMKVGSAKETVIVEANVPTVDVQNVAHPETLSRNYLDSVPTARNLQSVASYIRSSDSRRSRSS